MSAARTQQGGSKIPTRQNVIVQVSGAWEWINLEIIISAFLKCGIWNAVDRSEHDKIQEEILKEIELDDENNDADPFEDVNELDCISGDETSEL